ncbi:MAG: hypothetical protein IJP43_06210 [Oscillospiraceae bacterium]|nr:hypothetical protein [Oscillospiraceae bacterium]
MLTVPYIKNGDAYSVPIEILNNDEPLDLSAVDKVEIVINRLRKVYPEDMTYDETEGVFLFPLTQEQTFAMKTSVSSLDVRVKLTTGDVIGIRDFIKFQIVPALSSEVL